MQQENETPKPQDTQASMRQINTALGLFICFFAVVVLISMWYTETSIGRATNLVAGLILLSIGSIMIFRSRSRPTD